MTGSGSHIDVAEIKARHPLAEIVSRYAGPGRRVGSRLFWNCPFHKDRTPSFALTPDRHSFVCFGCGARGDVLDFIMRMERCRFLEAVTVLNKATTTATKTTRPSRANPRPCQWSDRAEAIWRSSKPLIQTPGADYLASRRCPLPLSDEVRFHPRFHHWPTDTSHPALVSRVTDFVTGEPQTLHFTFIAPDGSAKASVERQKLLLPGHLKAGGVIRLVDDADVSLGLGITEGLENGLTIVGAGWLPIWAAVDAGNLARLPVLNGIESLTIFADADPVGMAAALTLTQRWAAAGYEARICAPPSAGSDWNSRLSASRV